MPLKQKTQDIEHIVYCRLSKRQGYLYDEFMSRSATKETLASVNFLSILNCLMQLRKVCCHPDLFEVRPIVSPFLMEPLTLPVPSLAMRALHVDPFSRFPHPTATSPPWVVDLTFLGLQLIFPEPQDHGLTNPARSIEKLGTFLHDIGASSVTPLMQTLLEAFPEGHGVAGLLRSSSVPTADDLAGHDEQLLYCQRNRQHLGDNVVGRYTPKLLEMILSLGEECRRQPSISNPILEGLVLSPQDREEELRGMIHQFVCVIPPVTSPTPRLSLSKPCPYIAEIEMVNGQLMRELKAPEDVQHSSKVRMETFFPDKRLLQYDCGKLQKLDELLKQLKSGNHRVLIFSQMTKMLDIFEIFLSLHGYRYLRLDGTTKVEQRQQLIERFNSDQRYFVFILSTRSGGVGINLTGADTVIFYDSDWNPAMDAQAQDRCHRIGQTREVHIYRLITEHSIEENILRKANQKRLLDDVVIQGGTFTTEFFQRQMDWKGLFQQRGMANEFDKGNEGNKDGGEGSAQQQKQQQALPKMTQNELEQALTAVEDETDVQAMKQAKTEISQELEDFDADAAPLAGESSRDLDQDGDEVTTAADEPLPEGIAAVVVVFVLFRFLFFFLFSFFHFFFFLLSLLLIEPPAAPVDQVDQEFEASLGPIERYALRFVENYYPHGLTLAIEQATTPGKKGAPSSAAPVVLTEQLQESGEPTPVTEGGELPLDMMTMEGGFELMSPSPRPVSARGGRGRMRGRVRGISGKAKPTGILQTPGRRSGNDYLAAREPKALKAKEKGKRRGRGGGVESPVVVWAGSPEKPTRSSRLTKMRLGEEFSAGRSDAREETRGGVEEGEGEGEEGDDEEEGEDEEEGIPSDDDDDPYDEEM